MFQNGQLKLLGCDSVLLAQLEIRINFQPTTTKCIIIDGSVCLVKFQNKLSSTFEVRIRSTNGPMNKLDGWLTIGLFIDPLKWEMDSWTKIINRIGHWDNHRAYQRYNNNKPKKSCFVKMLAKFQNIQMLLKLFLKPIIVP